MSNYFIGKITEKTNENINYNNISKKDIDNLKKLKKYYYNKTNEYQISIINEKIFSNEDENLFLICYGEIYNFNELSDELKRKGHAFKTNDKTEIILHGYEEYDTDILNKLNGCFSFVIYNKTNNSIFAARDYLGIKPFYYYYSNNELCFSSSLTLLVNNFSIKKVLNLSALENYLTFQYSVLEESFYKDIYKLEHGHYMLYKDSKLVIKKYYTPEFKKDNNFSFEKSVEKINNITKEIVNDYETNSNSITTFLSSGVDSSYITSLTKKVEDTYTIGFEGLEYNEVIYAKELSKKLNKKNNIIMIDGDKYFKATEEILKKLEEPLADPSSIGLYLLCKEASKNYDTALIGEGADEFFGGYNVYQEPLQFQFYNKIPLFIRKLIGTLCNFLPQVKGINFLVRRGKIDNWYIGNANIFSYKERNKILNFKNSKISPDSIVNKYYNLVKDEDSITKMQFIDINLWLVGDELFNAEMMGKLNNINLKAPFLNKKIVDFALTIPKEYRVNKNNTKYILRESAKNTLEEKWYNKKKLGFPIPLKNWLKEEKYYNIVKEIFESKEAEMFFKIKKIIRLLNDHKNGKKDNSRKIWVIYIFVLWYKNNFGEKNDK